MTDPVAPSPEVPSTPEPAPDIDYGHTPDELPSQPPTEGTPVTDPAAPSR